MTKKTAPLRSEIRSLVAEIEEKYPQNKNVARQVEALINSLGDTLSDERVLEELKALKASGRPFQKVIASLTPDS